MRKYRGPLAAVVAVAVALALAACGSSSNSSVVGLGASASSSTSSSSASGGAPEVGGTDQDRDRGARLYDPQEYQTVQADSALHLVYDGPARVQGRHRAGEHRLIPALAEAPDADRRRKTYVFQIRPNLHYSDGEPVKASDVVNWSSATCSWAARSRRSTTTSSAPPPTQAAKKPNAPLSGIIADDATGKITIHLIKPDGAFSTCSRSAGRRRPGEQGDFKNMTGNPFPGAGRTRSRSSNPSPTNGEFSSPRTPNSTSRRSRGQRRPDRRHGLDQRQHDDGGRDQRRRFDFMTDDPAGDLLAAGRVSSTRTAS